MSGCSTCGIPYAGVKLEAQDDKPNECSEYVELVELVENDENYEHDEDSILVNIKNGIDYVETSHRGQAPFSGFNFYASQYSSMFISSFPQAESGALRRLCRYSTITIYFDLYGNI